MLFIIRRLKKLPIFDLFLHAEESWQGWSRISIFSNNIRVLDGRKLNPSEKQQALLEINTNAKSH